MSYPLIAALALAVAANAVAADDAAFQAKRTEAAKNAEGKTGTAYDDALGKAINGQADFASRASACLHKFPGEQKVDGYFEFAADGGYRVVLRPEGGFSRCLTQVLEGRTLPVPPRRPYLNPFSFSNRPIQPVPKKIVVTKDMLRELDGSPIKPVKPAVTPAPTKKP